MITRFENPLLAWESGTIRDVPLRIFPVVGPGRIGHIRWSPCHIGFGLVRHQGFAMTGKVFVDRLELRIIGHDELAAAVLDLHSNVLPDLDRHRSLREVAVDLLDGVGTKRSTVKPVRIEGRTKSDVSMA